MTGIEQFDDAKCVVVEENGIQNIIVAWSGGVTFNVYSELEGDIREVTLFTCSDENGKPLEPDKAVREIYEWIENQSRL